MRKLLRKHSAQLRTVAAASDTPLQERVVSAHAFATNNALLAYFRSHLAAFLVCRCLATDKPGIEQAAVGGVQANAQAFLSLRLVMFQAFRGISLASFRCFQASLEAVVQQAIQ